jgi:hypothetical protein
MAEKMDSTHVENKMNTKQLAKHYRDAIEFLDDHYAYFLTHVLHIGRPKWDEAVGTACVAMQEAENKKNGEFDFDFMFAPKFASTLPVEEMAFVLAHEAFHIVLNHLKLIDNFVDRRTHKRLVEKIKNRERLTKDELKELLEQQQNSAKFNIAADAVINDYLVNNGFKPLMKDGELFGIYGHKIVGQNCAYLTVTDVFDMLPEQKQDQGQCQTCGGSGQKPEDQDKQDESDEGDDQDGEGQGEGDSEQEGENAKGGAGKAHGEDGKGEPCPDCKGSGKGQGLGQGMGLPGDSDGRGGDAFDNHDWMLDPDWAEKMAEAIDKLNDEMDKQGKLPQDVRDKMDEELGGETEAQKALNNSMRHGSEEGNMREFVEKHGMSMAWVKLLKEVDPMMFKEPGVGPPPRAEWHKRPRKLGAFRDVNLPVYGTSKNQEKRSKEKKCIVLALDYSGSCGPDDADKFASLAKSIPQDRVKVLACTFTTTWKNHDLENPLGGGSGGTDFNAIADFIEQEVRPELKGEYPTAVVVITDGQAPFSNAPQGKEAESWLWLLSPDRTAGYYPAAKTIGRWAMLDEYVL